MVRYAIFVKGILDYLDNLSMDQIRILFKIFSVLAFEVGRRRCSFFNGVRWQWMVTEKCS